ncbi:MAG: GIY-YIG nuclease family protein [Candidatus Cloacimonadota bacterium]|nr:GIY-YIG nuclease family protein [Candidatus Cloacimonadota bacterium]
MSERNKYYTYVLHSPKYNKIYIGYTNNLERRIYFQFSQQRGTGLDFQICSMEISLS